MYFFLDDIKFTWAINGGGFTPGSERRHLVVVLAVSATGDASVDT